MTSYESRAGETIHGPLQLRSFWTEHELRNFDLMVIIQASGCEHIAQKVIAGGGISENEKSVLEIANDLGKQKGYKPLFDVSDPVRVSEGATLELERFFNSAEWSKRDRTLTRKI